MKYCSCFIILLDVLVLCYAGDAKVSIDLPKTIFFGEPAFGICAVNNLKSSPRHIRISVLSQHCKATNVGKFYSTERLNYQQNFTMTCRSGSSPSVPVNCFVSSDLSPTIRDIVTVKVIEKPATEEPVTEQPTIINKPENITTVVGLPVTLKCYVEGDPSHYLVGWMSQNKIVQEGTEHSISTSPSFTSANGTVHYLTVHTVKTSGKYNCNVYTINKKVVDQVTHQVHVDKGNNTEPSFLSALSKLLF